MTRQPDGDPVITALEAVRRDRYVVALAAAVAAAKGPDPLAPVTVIAPSAYAALFTRRALGAAPGVEGRRGVANVNCTTLDNLTRQLGVPGLAARGLRLAAGPVDLEAIRTRALAAGGWLADLVAHPRGLVALRDAVVELRRCPVATIDALSRRRGRIGELARQVSGVRAHLHARGFADSVDLAEAATEAAAGDGAPLRALGPVLSLDPGPVTPSQRQILDLVVAGAGTPPIATGPGASPSILTEVRACADPDEEVRAAVRTVVAAVDAGVPCWRQAIFHPPGPAYARAIHHELAAAGVAANGPGTRHLDRSVAGATLLGLLELTASDWARSDVMAWLSAAPIVAARDGRRVPASRWDALSARAGVVHGAAQWGERLTNLARREAERAPEAKALASFVENLVASASSPRGSWSTHAAWAVELIDRYLDADPESWPTDEVAATEQVRGAVLSLGDLDTVSQGTDLGAFHRAVRTMLEETALDGSDLPDGGFGDGVFVAPFGRARGLRFEGVVLVGLADAVVPGAVGDDALLPEDIRRLDMSGGLRTRAARLRELHDDVGAAIGAGATRRVATYPRVDPRTGRAQVPSRFLASLTAIGTRNRSVQSFAAGISAADPALSVRELELHDMARWSADGHDPTLSPVALSSRRLQIGITAARDRTGNMFTRFDGSVGVGVVSPFLADTPMSATRLEAYAKCPRRFLYERVLGVSRRTLPEELWQMEPAERGTLVHEILEEYLLERLAGATRSPARLLAIAEAQFSTAEARGLVGKALLWRMDRAAIRRDLLRFHDEEGDLVPLAAELEFGTGAEGADPAVTVMVDGGHEVHFKGKADRVDRASSGELVVSDYKTGKQRMLSDLKKDPVAGGRLLQLPIYAMAARARFGGDTVRARYWLLSEQRSAPCYSLSITDEVQARFLQVLALITGAVEAGAFPGAPTEKSGDRQFEACRQCDFDVLCPTTRDRQWARKSHSPEVAPVLALMNADVPDHLDGAIVNEFDDKTEAGT
jgi:RecB family exonuclease